MTFPETFPLIYEGDGRGGDQFRCRHCGFVSKRDAHYQHAPSCRWQEARFEVWRREHEAGLAAERCG